MASGKTGATSAWAWLCGAWLTAMFLIGGTSQPLPNIFLIQSVSAGIMLGAGLWRLRDGLPTRLASTGLLLAGLTFVLGLMHLVPLPLSLWQLLPARETVNEALRLAGEMPASLPLTLSPDGTKGALLAMLVPLAAFVAVLSLKRRECIAVSGAVFLCGLIGVLIGLLQRFLGDASGLYLYGTAGNLAVGTFGNRNFFATQMVITIPMAAAFIMAWREKLHVNPVVLTLFSIVCLAMLLSGLAASGSRSGIILGSIAILLTALLVFRLSSQEGRTANVSKLSVVIVVLLVVISQVGMITITRFVETDAMEDFRSTVFAVTTEAFWAFFPFGSGLGSFVPVYQMFEKPTDIIQNYVNAAHSDWLQVLLEGGAPVVVLLALFVVWYLTGLAKSLRAPAQDYGTSHMRAAALAMLLILLHAVVDFPLRVPAILVMFGAFCGLLALISPSQPQRRGDGGRPQDRDDRPDRRTDAPAPFRSVGRFGSADREPKP
jgi:O-antigen ligase